MLVYHYTVRMNDTDAAGRIYFADQFRIAHETFEEHLAAIGHHFGRFLNEYPFMIPIVHADADFKVPLFVGDTLRIELSLGRIGRSSFRLDYRIVREPEEVDTGSVSVTHAAINKATGKTIPVPEEMLKILDGLK